MEHDEEVATIYDAAEKEDRLYDEWRQAQDDEREMRLHDALTACAEAGVSAEHLKVLAFETGTLRWALEESIKRERTWFKDDPIERKTNSAAESAAAAREVTEESE